jgi:CubicO group peptidase (beta-lactamase class C family)
MKKLMFFAIIIQLGVGCNTKNTTSNQSSLIKFADSLFKANVDSSMIAGASVLVFQNGKMLLDKSFGYASLELSAPMPDHASFEIGSVTKQFTAAAILRLVKEGKLSLDDDFTKYLNFDIKGRTVTINQLLNHTSGIQGCTEMAEYENLSMLSFDRDTLVRLVEKKDFLFEPGEAMIYNNTAYFFLGLIIIKVSGKSYIDYLNEQFFQPLGMNHTYYCSTREVTKNKAYGYSYTKNGLEQKQYLDHIWPFAAGSLCSTTEDLLIWMRALHQGKVFEENEYSLLTTPGFLKDGSPLRYAMGLANYSLYKNKMIGHGGGINGFLSETRYFPKADLYLICLINTTGPNGASFFTNQLTWKLLTKGEEESKKIDAAIQTLQGTYAGQARGRILSVQVSALANVLTLKSEGKSDLDTLKIYLGNNTWARGNDHIKINNNEVIIDNVIGHFILRKIKK